MVHSTDRSKAVVPVLVLLFVALWFILWGDLFYVLPCVILFLCVFFFFFFFFFFSPFSIAITSLGEERTSLCAFHTFVRFALVWGCLFPLPLGVWEGLWFVIVALPGLFSYPLFVWIIGVLCSGHEQPFVQGCGNAMPDFSNLGNFNLLVLEQGLHSSSSLSLSLSLSIYIYIYIFIEVNICCGYSLEMPRWADSNKYINMFCFLREVRRMSNVGHVNFDHLTVRGQVMKFDKSTTLLLQYRFVPVQSFFWFNANDRISLFC